MTERADRITLQKILLICGIVSSLLYVAMNVFIPLRWVDYSLASQAVSELSAIGAPTRTLWVPLGIVYSVLVSAFGWGVWTPERGRGSLRVVGTLLMAQGVFGLFWPPMHLRGAPFTVTDALHIVWSGVTLILMLLVWASRRRHSASGSVSIPSRRWRSSSYSVC
jgi:hypothetical protein